MAHYIFSTLTAGVDYVDWRKTEGGLHTKHKTVSIKGGANLADKHNAMYTPKGVVTEVSNEDFEFLLNHPIFIKHIENGFIRHEPKEVKIEKGIADLNAKDKSAPETPEALEKKKAQKRQ